MFPHDLPLIILYLQKQIQIPTSFRSLFAKIPKKPAFSTFNPNFDQVPEFGWFRNPLIYLRRHRKWWGTNFYANRREKIRTIFWQNVQRTFFSFPDKKKRFPQIRSDLAEIWHAHRAYGPIDGSGEFSWKIENSANNVDDKLVFWPIFAPLAIF